MKKTNIRKFLLLFCMLACVFCMTACSDPISNASAKESAKEQKVVGYQNELAVWSTDTIAYLDLTTDDQIKSDAENAKNIDVITGVKYKVNSDGINNKTIEFYNGWIKSRDDLGKLKTIDSIDIHVSDKTSELCTVIVNATYEKRECTFELVLDNDINLVSGAINPEYTTGEKVEKAALNTLIGMGTVFIVLIFISFIISLLKHVNKIGKKETPANASVQNSVNTEVSESTDDNSDEDNEVDDLELVAVITAAIVASENTSADGLVVRSIKKVNKTNNWRR